MNGPCKAFLVAEDSLHDFCRVRVAACEHALLEGRALGASVRGVVLSVGLPE